MAHYLVGDIQGCLAPLQRLLDQVAFDPASDRLLCAGDLVNRGPDSLATLRFLKTLGDSVQAVLGNHDLHLLAIYYGGAPPNPSDTLSATLAAPDCDSLCEWLRQQPMLIENTKHRYLLVHAGIPHIWSRKTTLECAKELEQAIRGDDCSTYFQAMYGNQPTSWHADLSGTDRLRTITNYLSRMRVINAAGTLDLSYRGNLSGLPGGYFPWFARRHPDWQDYKVFFGHWAALNGNIPSTWAKGLDTACVWGGRMRFYRVKDGALFHSDCADCGQPRH